MPALARTREESTSAAGVFIGVAFIAALVALPTSAAGSAIFVATPSYTAFGAHPLFARVVANHTLSGFNLVEHVRSFRPATGEIQAGLRSIAMGNDSGYGQYLRAGFKNLTFICGSNCSPGKHQIALNLVLSWHIQTNSTCLGTAYTYSPYASAEIDFYVIVSNQTKIPWYFAISHGVLIGYESLRAKGSQRSGTTDRSFKDQFNVSLTPSSAGGGSANSTGRYYISGFFYLLTYAVTVGTTSSSCRSSALAAVGVNDPTVLQSVTVS